MNRFKVLGINDDRDVCECCGKSGLKRVVWIEDTETQEIRHFGTTCAVKPAKGFGVDLEVKKAIKAWKGLEDRSWAMASREFRATGGEFRAPTAEEKAKDPCLMAVCADKPRLTAIQQRIFNEIKPKSAA